MKNQRNKRIILLFLLIAIAGVIQAADGKPAPDYMASIMTNVLLGTGIMVIAAAVFTLAQLAQTMMTVQKMRILQEQGIDILEKAGLANTETWFQRQWKKFTPAVPVEKEADIMLDHNYDGIQELDNSLPPWWVAVFYLSIGFAVFYIVYNHFTEFGKTQEEKYEILMEEAEIAVLDYLEKQADAVNETNATALLDEASIASGKVIFEKNCVTCHGPQGQGVAGLGPNFCDPYWIYGGDIKDVFRTIKHGTEKGMAPWKEQLRPMEIHKVASFIMTLQGTNPPNPKEPEGTLYETKNAEIHNDSLATEEIGMLIK